MKIQTKITTLELTLDGVSSSSISRSAVVDVPDSKHHVNAWKEYLIGDIHCTQTIQSAMKGKGTSPPDAARKTMTFADPTKKARSWDHIRMEVNLQFYEPRVWKERVVCEHMQ